MGGFKAKREAEDIKRELSAILREMKDPRVRKGMISVLRVELSNDLSSAKVHISALDGMEAAKEAILGLKQGMGFIRGELSHRIRMRKCPVLTFIADDSIAYSAHVQEILEELQEGSQEAPQKEKADEFDDKTGGADAASGK